MEGGDAREARASSRGSGPSPSKNLAIAIYSCKLYSIAIMESAVTCTFHSDLRSNGIA